MNDPQVNIVTPILDPSAPILSTSPTLAPRMVGDYNVGDTNENGIEDPGETFQYMIAGDDNDNGIQDPGEEFTFANVGDTNQNSVEDPGETFQYYNAGDTDHDGEEDPGETFQFDVSHAATSVDNNHDGFNDGDTNSDNLLSVGETWQYSVAYTVTQDDIDNGGVVDPALTHDNTATVTTGQGIEGEASASVSIVQNPHVTLTKAASVDGGTADVAGEVISYTIDVANDGNMTLTGLVVSDPSVDDLAEVESGGFNTGDTDMDGVFDVGEMWHFTASHTVTQADIDGNGGGDGFIDNTASATTDQGATSNDTASVEVVQPPVAALFLDKSDDVGTHFVDADEDGVVDADGDLIQFAFQITNTGNVVLHDVVINDPLLGGPDLRTGGARPG